MNSMEHRNKFAVPAKDGIDAALRAHKLSELVSSIEDSKPNAETLPEAWFSETGKQYKRLPKIPLPQFDEPISIGDFKRQFYRHASVRSFQPHKSVEFSLLAGVIDV